MSHYLLPQISKAVGEACALNLEAEPERNFTWNIGSKIGLPQLHRLLTVLPKPIRQKYFPSLKLRSCNLAETIRHNH